MRKVLLILLTMFSCTIYAQAEWTKFEELTNSFKQDKKAILIFVYTDWCKICKMQENIVFNDTTLSKLLKDKVYLLKLNAEEKNDILFFNRKYKGATTKQYHELAEYLAQENNTLNFPSIIILNRKLLPIYKSYSFINKEDLNDILRQL